MRSNVQMSLVALLFALQGCSPPGNSGATTETTAAPTDQPPGEQQPTGEDKKDPTLADSYIEAVGAGMVKGGAKQADVDAVTADVKKSMDDGGSAGLKLADGPDFNDPKTVFDKIPALMVDAMVKNKLEALLAPFIDESAGFIGGVPSNDKQGLFQAFSKSFMVKASDEQIAAATADLMKGLDKVVPKEQLGAAAPEFFGGLFDVIKEVRPDFDFAKHIGKFADASSAVGDPAIATDLFSKSLEVAKDFVPADKLDDSLGKLNDKATAFIGALPKDEVADKMAKFNAAVVKHVDKDKAGDLQAKIQEAIAKLDPALNDAFKAALDKKLKDSGIDKKKIDDINASANEQIKCPEGTVKAEFGCMKPEKTPTTPPDDKTDTPPTELFWVSDETKDPRVFAQFPEEKIVTLMNVPVSVFAEFKAADMTCDPPSYKTFTIYKVGDEVQYDRDCMSGMN